MLKWLSITADGTFTLGTKHNTGEIVLLVNGTFNSGTLTFGYRNRAGVFAPFASGTALTDAGEDSVGLAEGIVLMVELAGASSPTIELGVAGEFFTHSNLF